MSSILIIYSSVDGHTKTICERIEGVIKNSLNTTLMSLDDATHEDISKYDRIVIGASIRYGKHRPSLFNFIEKNLDLLNSKYSAFFTVNIVARKPEKNTAKTNPYMIKFLKKSPWKPNLLDVFAGKLDFPTYNFSDKYIIKFIMWITKGPTDTSKVYEFTNWAAVDNFAKKLIV
tara:strand:- start:62 stop:583 length:522 start_codon:yes stop_codon:yes gene_type:complete